MGALGLGLLAMSPWIAKQILKRGPGMIGGAKSLMSLGKKEGWKRALGTSPAKLVTRGKRKGEVKVPAGLTRRAGQYAIDKPIRTGLGLGLGGLAGSALMGGEQQEAAPTIAGGITQTGAAARMPNPWEASAGLMTNKEFKSAQSDTFWGNMNKMMQMSAILNATGGDTKGFQEMMTLANKKILSDAGDQRDIDTYDSVFVKGNMPNTAIEAYERMIKSKASPEQASKVAGHYVSMRNLRINTTEERDALLKRVTLLFEGGNTPAAVLAVKRGLAAGILPTNMFEDSMGNALTGNDLTKRIEEIFGGIVIE